MCTDERGLSVSSLSIPAPLHPGRRAPADPTRELHLLAQHHRQLLQAPRARDLWGSFPHTTTTTHTRHSDTRNTKTHTTRRHTQHNDTQISGTQETHQEHTSSGFCHLPQMRYVLVTMAGHNNIVCSEFNFTTKTHHLISCFVFIVVLSSPCTTML